MKASCIPVYNLDQRGLSSTNWRVGRTFFPLNGLVTTHQGRLGRTKALCFLYSGAQHSSKFRKILCLSYDFRVSVSGLCCRKLAENAV